MKKVITILMIICIMLCGCSKAPNEPTSTTPSINIPKETEKAEISPTQAAKKINTTCSVCGRIADCEEYIKRRYSTELQDYYEKAYYLCDTCLPKIQQNEADCENLKSLQEAAYLALTNEDVIEELKKQGEGYITLKSDGISFDNISQKLIDIIEVIIPDYKEIRSSKEGKIKIYYFNEDIDGTKIEFPTVQIETAIPNILDNLEK